jgi:hypothetical protein
MTNIDGDLRCWYARTILRSWITCEGASMLDHGISITWLLRHCSAPLLAGSAWVCLVTASVMAGANPTQPTAVVPADVAAAMKTTNTKCPTTVGKEQPLAASQKTSGRNSVAAAPTTTGAEVADVPEPPNTEILHDKLWSTSLSSSSRDHEVQKAPQCGITTAGQPPED